MDSRMPTTVLRVEKPIRMRIRYTCHVCEHLLGVERKCMKCKHKRCEECPRHPSRRSQTKDTGMQPFKAKKEGVTLRKREYDDVERITRSRSKGKSQAATDGPNTMPVMQLLQYSCHKCTTTFEQRGRLCSSCGHLRCSRCSRNLSNLSYSSGEDPLGPERVYRQPRQRIRWICDHCENTFREDSRVCGECLHKRCGACRRIP